MTKGLPETPDAVYASRVLPFAWQAQNRSVSCKETPEDAPCHRRTGAVKVSILGTVSGDFPYLQISIDDKDKFCQ